jgi:hypothetical protein
VVWAPLRGLPRGSKERAEVVREATIMVLYVSVVEIAELAALPEHHFANGPVTGPVGAELLAILWGTATGLALAHWFAFGLAARALRGERPTSLDTVIGVAQVGAAMFVAAVSSLPVLFFPNARAQQTAGDVPALIVGVVAYILARHNGKSRWASVLFGAIALAAGVLVALAKSVLAAH